MKRIPQEAYQRQRLLAYLRKTGSATKTALRYRVSRKTVYKWAKRWDGSIESLVDQSRRPHHSPRQHTEQELGLIRRQAKKHRWSDLILAYQEARDKGYTRSYGSFKRMVSRLRADKKSKPKARKNKPYQRADYPGQKVQVDVKFVPRECAVNGQRYYQFTAVDECSRWAFREMYAEHSTHSAADFLRRLILAAPFPIREIQTDNGPEFTNALLTNKADKKSLFEDLLEEYGIIYHRIRIATPRHNGKVERQHRLDQERFYNHLRMFSLEDGRKQLALYQRKSNDYIKHCLNLCSPNQFLQRCLAVLG